MSAVLLCKIGNILLLLLLLLTPPPPKKKHFKPDKRGGGGGGGPYINKKFITFFTFHTIGIFILLGSFDSDTGAYQYQYKVPLGYFYFLNLVGIFLRKKFDKFATMRLY
jgi:hypothetical protein